MKLLIHDLPEGTSPFPDLAGDFTVISTHMEAAPCQGCFRCWTKDPGYCVYADALQHSGAALGRSGQIVVVSQLCYGGYSPSVKRFFDRGISDCLPFLTYRKGRTRHMDRYKVRRRLTVYLYGCCDPFERETARDYVACHAADMGAYAHEVVFLKNVGELEGVRP